VLIKRPVLFVIMKILDNCSNKCASLLTALLMPTKNVLVITPFVILQRLDLVVLAFKYKCASLLTALLMPTKNVLVLTSFVILQIQVLGLNDIRAEPGLKRMGQKVTPRAYTLKPFTHVIYTVLY